MKLCPYYLMFFIEKQRFLTVFGGIFLIERKRLPFTLQFLFKMRITLGVITRIGETQYLKGC